MISKRHRYDPGQYAILPREAINNAELSFEARGMLLYLLEKPVDWVVSNEYLYRQSPAGERHVNTILRELKAAGYVHREKVYDPATRKFRWDTVVYDFPEDNPHFDPARIPTFRMDTERRGTKRRGTPRMDTKRGDDLILEETILEKPILEELSGSTPAAPAAEPSSSPPAKPVVRVGPIDRTPGGMGYQLPNDDTPVPVDYRRVKPTPELLAKQHPAVAAYWLGVGKHPGRENVELVIAEMGDEPDETAARRAAELWRGSSYSDKNVVGILEWYRELRRDPAWKPSDRFKAKANGNGKDNGAPDWLTPMKEYEPGLF